MTARVSSNTSLIAAQISSFVTRSTSSTVRCAIAKVWTPTSCTATASAKMPTWGSRTRRPASRERAIASASKGSTPITFTSGSTAFT